MSRAWKGLVPCTIAAFLLLACSPPRLIRFSVRPPNVCPQSTVGIDWEADASEVSVSSTPATDADGRRIAVTRGGFRYTVAAPSTTYTVSAFRGDHPPATGSASVRVHEGAVTRSYSLGFQCGSAMAQAAGDPPTEWAPEFTVDTVTNNGSQPITLEHLGASVRVGPGETQLLRPPVRLNGAWTAQGDFSVPVCPPPRSTGSPPEPPIDLPPPIPISVVANCGLQ